MGCPYFDMEFCNRFPYAEMELSRYFCGLEMSFLTFFLKGFIKTVKAKMS